MMAEGIILSPASAVQTDNEGIAACSKRQELIFQENDFRKVGSVQRDLTFYRIAIL